MTRTLCFVAWIALSLFLSGCQHSDTYLDCVTRGSVSGDKNNEHKRACMKKYQQKIPAIVTESIKGESHFYENIQVISGTIYNRSQDWLITEVTIALYPDGPLGAKHIFNAEVEAEPLASSRFSINIYSGIKRSKPYTWNIEDAYGVPAR